ncbi:hypothetical protein RYX36_005602, partial [Vicia faba]
MLVTTLDARKIDAITCPDALLSLLPCLPYLQGTGPATPTSACCAVSFDPNIDCNT